MSQPKIQVADIINTTARRLHPTPPSPAPLAIVDVVLLPLVAIVVVTVAFPVCVGILIPPRGILEVVLTCASVEDDLLSGALGEELEGPWESVVALVVVGREEVI